MLLTDASEPAQPSHSTLIRLRPEPHRLPGERSKRRLAGTSTSYKLISKACEGDTAGGTVWTARRSGGWVSGRALRRNDEVATVRQRDRWGFC